VAAVVHFMVGIGIYFNYKWAYGLFLINNLILTVIQPLTAVYLPISIYVIYMFKTRNNKFCFEDG